MYLPALLRDGDVTPCVARVAGAVPDPRHEPADGATDRRRYCLPLAVSVVLALVVMCVLCACRCLWLCVWVSVCVLESSGMGAGEGRRLRVLSFGCRAVPYGLEVKSSEGDVTLCALTASDQQAWQQVSRLGTVYITRRWDVPQCLIQRSRLAVLVQALSQQIAACTLGLKPAEASPLPVPAPAKAEKKKKRFGFF